MGTGLPWATAPLPCYQQLLGSSAGWLGASTTGSSEPAWLLLCHTVSNEQGGRLCLCSRWAPRHWHVVTRYSGSAGSVFFHFNICSVPNEKMKIFLSQWTNGAKSLPFFLQKSFLLLWNRNSGGIRELLLPPVVPLQKAHQFVFCTCWCFWGVWDGSHVSGQVCWHGGSSMLLEGLERGWNAFINNVFYVK